MPIPYACFLVLSLLPFTLKAEKYIAYQKFFFYALLISIVVITGLRSQYVGTDSLPYFLSFSELNHMTFTEAYNTRFDAGYVALVRLVGYFSLSPYVFFFVVSVISFPIVFFFLRKYSSCVLLSILIFFCLDYVRFSVVIRQSLALCILFCGIPYLLKGKNIFFIFFVVLATQFHESAFVGISYLILNKIKFSKKTFIIFILTAIVLAFFNNIIWFVIETLHIDAYSVYATSRYNVAGSNAFIGFVIRVLPGLLVLALGQSVQKFPLSKEENFFYMACLTYVGVSIIAMSSLIFERLGFYYSFSVPIVASSVFSSMKIEFQTKKLYAIILLFFFVAYFSVIQVMRPNWSKITPYSPFWAPVNAYGIEMIRYFKW